MGDTCATVPCQLVKDIESDVKTLRRIVIEGNGEPSLVSRMTSAETKLAAIVWLSCATLASVLATLAAVIAKHF